jgi:hypothetical protein
LLIQTPCWREGRTYEQMVAEDDLFLEQFKANEHLNLFSQSSARELFRRLGAGHIAFEPPMFGYDMFILVSRRPMKINRDEEIEQALAASPDGRLIQAMLDGDHRLRALQSQHQQTEADRARRLDVIDRLSGQVREIEADREARLRGMQALEAQVHQLQAAIEQSQQQIAVVMQQRDQALSEAANRLKLIEQHAGQITQIEADRANRLAVIEKLSAEVRQFQQAAEERLKVIEHQQRQMAQIQQEHQALAAAQRELLNKPAVRALRRLKLA